jgi:glyoxylase-like metal-dependent hydrolase (beta-lactamase superfamily II)
MKILEGIYRVDEASNNLAHSNVYLVINDGELAVIDTGTAGNAKKIAAFIQKLGYKLADVTVIIITHFHVDHTGSAKQLKILLPNAKIAVHEADAQYVSGEQPLPKPKNLFFRVASSFLNHEPFQADIQLKEGDTIAGLKVIHTPGHTPGSIALMDSKRRALFVGDTLRFDGKIVTGAPERFTWDKNKAEESIAKISALEFDVMLPGHGEPLEVGASEAVKKFYQGLKQA